jgi:hypothetical protein
MLAFKDLQKVCIFLGVKLILLMIISYVIAGPSGRAV